MLSVISGPCSVAAHPDPATMTKHCCMILRVAPMTRQVDVAAGYVYKLLPLQLIF